MTVNDLLDQAENLRLGGEYEKAQEKYESLMKKESKENINYIHSSILKFSGRININLPYFFFAINLFLFLHKMFNFVQSL